MVLQEDTTLNFFHGRAYLFLRDRLQSEGSGRSPTKIVGGKIISCVSHEAQVIFFISDMIDFSCQSVLKLGRALLK